MPRPYSNQVNDAVTVPRAAAVYLGVVAVALAIALPVLINGKSAARSAHRERASQLAENMATYMDNELIRWRGQSLMFRGCVMSAAPLAAPDYSRDNATVRVAIAIRPATPGAFSLEAYNRLTEQAASSVRGFRSVVVQPGFVNALSGASTVGGQDWLENGPARAEFDYMVNSSIGEYFRPAVVSAVPGVTNIITRSVIWTATENLTTDMDARDPTLGGWHPNWRYAWGAVSALFNVALYADDPELFALANTSEFDFTFESAAMTSTVSEYPNVVIINTTDSESVRSRDPVSACSQFHPLSALMCFRLVPAKGAAWDGDDYDGRIVMAVVLACAVPLALLVAAFVAVRMAAGPEPDPLQFLPRAPPFHAVCVDMVDAPQLWVDAPFIMHDVSTTFEAQLQATAERTGVFVALRMGNTAIAIGTTRERVLDFTHELSEWALTYAWPPHVNVHCPRGTIAFSFALHTCDDVSVRVDAASGTSEVSGVDMQLLLMMRVPAVPQHAICTGQFLGLASPDARQQQRRGGAGGAAAVVEASAQRDAAREIVAHVTGPVERLGVCGLPVASAMAPVTRMEGFLMESPATADRALNDVLDSFPDSVWAEWQTGRDTAAHDDVLDQSGFGDANPLASATGGGGGGYGRAASATGMGGASASRTHNMSVASRRVVTGAHLNNDEAAARLPGSAVDAAEARKLATVLAPLLLAPTAGSRTAASRHTAALGAAADSAAENDDTTYAGSNCATSNAGSTRASVTAGAARLQRALSLGTYFLAAFRIVFAPLDPAVRQAMVAKITSAAGVPAEEYGYALAARCTRLNAHYVDAGADGAAVEEDAAGPVTRRQEARQQQQQQQQQQCKK